MSFSLSADGTAVFSSPPLCARTFPAPPSKSELQRYLICAALSDAPVRILYAPGALCGDVLAAADCLSALGAVIERRDGLFSVRPLPLPLAPGRKTLNVRGSGTALRFLLPTAAALGAEADFILSPQLAARPTEPLCRVLEGHGVTVKRAPLCLSVSGRFSGGETEVDGSLSSQFAGGLLLALSLTGGTLRVTGKAVSTPYLHLTGEILRRFGVGILQESVIWHLNASRRLVSPGTVTAGGDWSGAAFLLICGLIGPRPVTVTGLAPDSVQGDRAITDILRRMGGRIESDAAGVTAYPSSLHGTVIDASPVPDLVPPLCAAAAAAEGTTVFHGVAHLRVKESDRVEALKNMLLSLGGSAQDSPDTLTVNGGGLLGGTADAVNDHRVAMAAAAASLICRDSVTVRGYGSVDKSFPSFTEFITGQSV